jgi:hypothetical protein
MLFGGSNLSFCAATLMQKSGLVLKFALRFKIEIRNAAPRLFGVSSSFWTGMCRKKLRTICHKTVAQ